MLALLLSLLAPDAPANPPARADIVFADFEGDDYGPWKSTGTAFGPAPAAGTLPNQMAVEGFAGKKFASSFHGGDDALGTLASPEFKVDRKHVRFLIGGGGYAGKTCVNLVVDDKIVRTATGPNTKSGGSERLEERSWDVTELEGQRAKIVVVDAQKGGWGHISLDYIVFSDIGVPPVVADASRTLKIEKRFLRFPVGDGPVRTIRVSAGGKEVRRFTMKLAERGKPLWFAALDVDALKGADATVTVDRQPADSEALAKIEQADAEFDELVSDPRRPGFHISPPRGWLNDPNGMVYVDGVWHVFYQHNPFGTEWGNMHWRHAVSRDLVRWEDCGIALSPDELGAMFSGSAVVDYDNTAGFGKGAIILIYTAAGADVQCLASSTDGGKTFTKFAGNPVVPKITGGNRDPKVFWHTPSKHWVLTLYVAAPKKDGKGEEHTIQILTSPDLKKWTLTDTIPGFFECPDLFPLSVDGDAKNVKWVLTAADAGYMIGAFDGKKFVAETKKLPGHFGKGFYAAQTFGDVPEKDGRRVQIGWLQAPSPGSPFNQCLSIPQELRLRATPDGVRLTRHPVKELSALSREEGTVKKSDSLADGTKLGAACGEFARVSLSVVPGDATEIRLDIRGTEAVYRVKDNTLAVGGHTAEVPLIDGRLLIEALIDRTSLELFAAGGRVYVPLPVLPAIKSQAATVEAKGGRTGAVSFGVDRLRPTWEAAPKE